MQKWFIATFSCVIVAFAMVSYAYAYPPQTTQIAKMGENVRVGELLVKFPRKAPGIPVIGRNSNNVFIYGNYICMEVWQKNLTSSLWSTEGSDFELTWTPKGGNTEYYNLDLRESYNLDTATYRNGKYSWSLPILHKIKPKQWDKMVLVYDIPNDVSPNSIGNFGAFLDISASHQQHWELATLG